jgi:hypothetical protein
VLQQGSNEFRDRILSDNHTLLHRAFSQRTNIEKERAVADSRNRLAVPVGLTNEMDRQSRFREGNCGTAKYDDRVINHRRRVRGGPVDFLRLAR